MIKHGDGLVSESTYEINVEYTFTADLMAPRMATVCTMYDHDSGRDALATVTTECTVTFHQNAARIELNGAKASTTFS